MKVLKRKLALVLALIAVLAMCGSALAQDIYVAEGSREGDGSLETPFGTIREAILAADKDDVINIEAGRYEVLGIEITKPLTLKGAGAEDTIFYGTLENSWFDKMLTIGSAGTWGQDMQNTRITDIGFECTTTSGDVMDAVMIYITGKGAPGSEIIIENCNFTGLAQTDGDATAAMAILTPYGGGDNSPSDVIIRNNTVKNVKHGIFLNDITNVSITDNNIDTTIQNGININNGPACSGITISGNTLTNISTTTKTEGILPGEDLGINIADEATNFTVTDNGINMSEGKQDKALSDTITQVAHVTTPDEQHIYFSTLKEAVESEKTADGSKITLLSQPDTEDKNVPINSNLTIYPGDYDYTPVVGDGVEIVENEDGSFSIVVSEPVSPDVPEKPTSPDIPEEPTSPDVPPSSGGSGGGCSAGFGALALLAAVPMLFRRKK